MKTLRMLALAIVVLMATAAVAYGADQIRDRGTEPQHDKSPDKIQLQKKLQDGSCQDVVTDSLLKAEVAADDDAGPAQTRDRDQLRDGSGENCDGACAQTQAQDCTQTRQQDGTQTQTRDGNAWDDGDAGHEGDGGGTGGTGGSDDDAGQSGGCGGGDGGCGDGGH